jgi:PTH1 family peptidyl-tRNA hydrolase
VDRLWLVVGLGNVGAEYRASRHNMGFMVADRLAEAHRIEWTRRRFRADVAPGELAGERVILLKPRTYMNLSGEAVGPAAGFFKIAPARVLVIHDDIDLPFGAVRVKARGGHGGHNGLRSIHEALGSDGYPRVRVGIGRPGLGAAGRGPAADEEDDRSVTDFVLSRFSRPEKAMLGEVIERGVRAVEAVVASGVLGAMNDFNGRPPVGGEDAD